MRLIWGLAGVEMGWWNAAGDAQADARARLQRLRRAISGRPLRDLTDRFWFDTASDPADWPRKVEVASCHRWRTSDVDHPEALKLLSSLSSVFGTGRSREPQGAPTAFARLREALVRSW